MNDFSTVATKLALLCAAALFFFGVATLPGTAHALPAYSRLYQAKYGYRPSCAACHTSGGGSTVTDYGRDFLRAGANFPAYARVEGKDSDGDKVQNLEEIKAKANPGDPRSVPANAGDWLKEAEKVPIPEEQLKELFPDADAFAALEGTLKPDQVAAAEGRLGVTLTEEDKVPTFYFAIKGGKKYGVAEFVSAGSAKGPISVAVAMDAGATVTGVRILKNPTDKGVEDAAFLGQFRGKKAGDPMEVGRDLVPAKGSEEVSTSVAVSVRKAVAAISIVFAK